MSNSQKDNNSGYVPASDDKGLRKTFRTPEFVNAKEPSIKTKYPFATTPIGESFPVLYTEMGKKSLLPYVSRMGKKHNKKFVVTDCPEYQCHLISCIPMTETEAVQSSSNVVEASSKLAVPIDTETERLTKTPWDQT